MLNATTRATLLTLCLAGALAACGGGAGNSGGLASVAGGGGGPLVPALPGTPTPSASAFPSATPSPLPSASGPASPTPAPGQTATPAPGQTATPTPVPNGYFAQGTVRDFDSGAAIAGATVVIAPPVYAGATPPPGVATSTTTAADGSFTLSSLIPGSNYIEVFNPGFATLHKKLNITSFNNQLGAIPITFLTPDQTSWLSQVNSDRAAWSAPAVVFDELLIEGARHWANYMGTNGWYQSSCPGSDPSCQTALQYEATLGGTYTSAGSNVDAQPPPGTWQTAQSRMMAESSKCPQPVSPATCPGSNAPEFLNIVNPNFIWVGLTELNNGKGNSLATPFLNYYDQEFATPIHQ